MALEVQMIKKWLLIFIVAGGITMLSGCETKGKEEVEQSFEKVLAIYPTENLMDFYDMEGYRDGEFDEEDKGVWVLHSSMSITLKEEDSLLTEGMLLRIDRNTLTAEGFYFQRIFPNEANKKIEEKKYPVIYDEKGFHLIEDISDSKLKEKIENFQFFVQYGKFDDLSQYENISKMYNPEVPVYELEYRLTNEEYNVKQLRERYDVSTDKAPILLLKGQGDIDGSSVGYKSIEIRFSKTPSIVFDDLIDYQTSTKENEK